MTGATQAQAADCGKPTRPQTIREFERSLLTLGFSQREAKAVASGGFKATFPTNELGEQLDALAEAVARCQTILKG